MGISAVVLTKNSEKTVDVTLASLIWCDEIVVIDDNSTDNTRAVAKKYTSRIFIHTLSEDFSSQRNYGLEKARQDWILFVDSDEVVDEALREEIILRIKSLSQVNGYYIKREDAMWGRKLSYGETKNMWLLRLAKKGSGVWQGKVHEEWKIIGEKGRLRNPLSHFPHPNVHDFLTSINKYSTIRAKELYEKKVGVSWIDVILYPKAKFFLNYILRQGYKDGIPGFLVAILMSFHSFLVRGKLWQLQNSHK